VDAEAFADLTVREVGFWHRYLLALPCREIVGFVLVPELGKIKFPLGTFIVPPCPLL